jgi:Flp pilus assembly protein TadD
MSVSRSFELAQEALQRGDMDRAEAILSDLVGQSPSSPEAWYYLGSVLAQKARYREAAAAIDKALTLGGDFFEGLHDLGVLATRLGRPSDAIALFEKAQALRPRSWQVFNNKGIAFNACGKLDDAVKAYDEALRASDYRDPFPWMNKGVALHDLGRFGEAIEAYRKAIELKPDYGEALCNLGYVLLTLGKFDEGWRLHEHRWSNNEAERQTGVPKWLGDVPLAGKKVLLWAEQGYGDTVQFCRYAPLVAQLGGRVTIEVQPPLRDLIATLGDFETVVQGQAGGGFDHQVPLLSLPLAFRTTLASVPATTPYLKANPQHMRHWQERLPYSRRKRVGIACSGRQTHRTDRERSIPLRHFAPLQAYADLFLVQTHVREQDQAVLAECTSIDYVGNQLKNFHDTAALVSCLDLIVTVDTSLAHVAGALGKPVYVLLPSVPEWRWLLERDDSPWYPTARLFRQQYPGRWDDVMEKVAHAV